MKKVLITGGAGFIGSHFVDLALENNCQVLVVDKLSYAGTRLNLKSAFATGRCELIQKDICEYEQMVSVIQSFGPNFVVNFAAESHVDNSITGPREFIQTNIVGTFSLLEASRNYFKSLGPSEASGFRYLQISTDEVFGDLGEEGFFTETTAYNPHSPYSASKASSDHLVRAWRRTYGLPTLVTNCSNNYGPRQYPEKLIPHIIQCALSGKQLPVYGDGKNVRDWIHVKDHCYGVWLALTKAEPGSTYCFGGRAEMKNIDVVKLICEILDKESPRTTGSYNEQIHFVKDRPGHDWRYAIDDSLAEKNLSFQRKFKDFESGLRDTVLWYLSNKDWVEEILHKKKFTIVKK